MSDFSDGMRDQEEGKIRLTEKSTAYRLGHGAAEVAEAVRNRGPAPSMGCFGAIFFAIVTMALFVLLGLWMIG